MSFVFDSSKPGAVGEYLKLNISKDVMFYNISSVFALQDSRDNNGKLKNWEKGFYAKKLSIQII